MLYCSVIVLDRENVQVTLELNLLRATSKPSPRLRSSITKRLILASSCFPRIELFHKCLASELAYGEKLQVPWQALVDSKMD